MGQAIQMVGAVLVLAAFVLNQRRRLSTDSTSYLALNAFGTGILAVVAGVNRDVGFTLLEGTWAIVSAAGLVRAVRPSAPSGRNRSCGGGGGRGPGRRGSGPAN